MLTVVLSKFRDSLLGPSLRGFLDSCAETSARKYRHALRNNPKEWKINLHLSGSLKFQMTVVYFERDSQAVE